MPPKQSRLTRAEFQTVWNMGKKTHNPLFTLVKQESFDENSHFAVVVSKKVCRTAVKRNLLRRKLYPIIQKNLLKSKASVIFVAKKGLEVLSSEEIEKSVFGTQNE